VVKAALRISRLTQGAFDVTIGPVVNLWGFGPQTAEEALPSDKAVKDALAKVGYERVHVRDTPPALRKERSDINIDLSAIAKGYGVDKIAQYLEAQGIGHYLVEIGGELRGKGLNPNGVPWRIAIEKPDPGQRVIERIIQISDRGVATSGDYRNFFEIAGQRYSHTMDPRTGRPVRHDLASVTVVSDTCMEADALATALLVMGPEQGFRFAQSQGIEAFFIVIGSEGFTERSTAGFERYVVD
jgi:thiamine biosynthesis lipoprotein